MRITTSMLDKRNRIMSIVSRETGVPTDDIMSETRRRKVASARMMVMWALYTYCGYSTKTIGILMRRHHTSVVYAIGMINGGYRLSKDEKALKKMLGEEVSR